MVTVATGSRPLVVSSDAMLLKATPHCVFGAGVREGGGRLAQLGIKLSLFGTLPCGAPA